MEPFVRHSGILAVVPGDNVDTDRIIPARFLSMVTRSGYGDLLYCDVRGPEFPLDQPSALCASILVVGNNFGCGSSREHAVWAIQQAGFKAVVAKKTPEQAGYSDIFRQNAANCGLLLIELDPWSHAELTSVGQGATASIDLVSQTIESGGRTWTFEIAAALKDQLVRGLDLVGSTLLKESAISEYESRSPSYVAGKKS